MTRLHTFSQTLNENLLIEPPKYLYHYTSPRGLLGIISNKEIWATNTRYLNDLQEVKEAFSIAKHVIEEYKDTLQKNFNENKGEFFFVYEIAKRLEHYIHDASVKYYVVSFSEKEDSLSQWRSYCPDTGGYAIGISSDQLEKMCTGQGFFFSKCIYDFNLQCAIMRELLKATITVFNENDLNKKDLMDEFVSHVAQIGPFFKNNGFKEEEEWRLISSSLMENENDKIGFREGNGTLIPYFKFQLWNDKNPFNGNPQNGNFKLMVGPSVDKDRAYRSAQMCILKYLQANVGAGISGIPYKSW